MLLSVYSGCDSGVYLQATSSLWTDGSLLNDHALGDTSSGYQSAVGSPNNFQNLNALYEFTSYNTVGSSWQISATVDFNPTFGGTILVRLAYSDNGTTWTPFDVFAYGSPGTYVRPFSAGFHRYFQVLVNGSTFPLPPFTVTDFRVPFSLITPLDNSASIFAGSVSTSLCRQNVLVAPARKNAGDEMDMAQDHASGLITIIRSVAA